MLGQFFPLGIAHDVTGGPLIGAGVSVSVFSSTWPFVSPGGGGILFGFRLAIWTMITPEVVLSFLQRRDFGLMLVFGRMTTAPLD